jgi:hypothetical protein
MFRKLLNLIARQSEEYKVMEMRYEFQKNLASDFEMLACQLDDELKKEREKNKNE